MKICGTELKGSDFRKIFALRSTNFNLEINDAGFIRIKGRFDDLIIKSGMNVYPAEIEGVIKQDPRVKEVLVYGYHNSFGTQIGMKLVGDFSSTEEVKQLCMKVLPSFQVPSVIELVDELPKNGSGKIIRRKMI